MLDGGTDGYYTERVERHTYPSYTILAGLMLYMYAGCSYRQVVKVMEVMSKVFSRVLPWIFKDKPSHACIEDWAEKAGLAAMRSKSKTLEGAYALILDESVDIGEDCMESVMETCKKRGLSTDTADTCREIIKRKLFVSGNQGMIELGKKMLAYFDTELKILKPNDKSHVISSDIIESLFGYYKGRKSPDKQAGITCSALVIHLRTVIGTQDSQLDDKIMRIFPTETVNTVARWRKETIGESNLSLRLAIFTKNRMTNFTPYIIHIHDYLAIFIL